MINLTYALWKPITWCWWNALKVQHSRVQGRACSDLCAVMETKTPESRLWGDFQSLVKQMFLKCQCFQMFLKCVCPENQPISVEFLDSCITFLQHGQWSTKYILNIIISGKWVLFRERKWSLRHIVVIWKSIRKLQSL